jgi:hypothetical protein
MFNHIMIFNNKNLMLKYNDSNEYKIYSKADDFIDDLCSNKLDIDYLSKIIYSLIRGRYKNSIKN